MKQRPRFKIDKNTKSKWVLIFKSGLKQPGKN